MAPEKPIGERRGRQEWDAGYERTQDRRTRVVLIAVTESYSSCHMLTFLAIACKKRFTVTVGGPYPHLLRSQERVSRGYLFIGSSR